MAKREVHTAAFLADRVRRPPRRRSGSAVFLPARDPDLPDPRRLRDDRRLGRRPRSRPSLSRVLRRSAAPPGRSSSSEPTMLAKCVRIPRIRLTRARPGAGEIRWGRGDGRHILALIGPAARGSSIGSVAMMLARRHRIASCSRRAERRQGAEAAYNRRPAPAPRRSIPWACPLPLSGSFSDPTPVSAARRLLGRRGGAHRRRSTQRLAATAPCSTPLHPAGSAPTPAIGAGGTDDGRGGGSRTGHAGRDSCVAYPGARRTTIHWTVFADGTRPAIREFRRSPGPGRPGDPLARPGQPPAGVDDRAAERRPRFGRPRRDAAGTHADLLSGKTDRTPPAVWRDANSVQPGPATFAAAAPASTRSRSLADREDRPGQQPRRSSGRHRYGSAAGFSKQEDTGRRSDGQGSSSSRWAFRMTS